VSALDELIRHHLDNVCKEIDKRNCVFVKDLSAIRVDNARLTKERDALRDQVRTERYFDTAPAYRAALADQLTTKPQYSGQASALCPNTQRVVFVPDETVEREWRYCEACQSCHRVVFQGGDKCKPVLRSI